MMNVVISTFNVPSMYTFDIVTTYYHVHHVHSLQSIYWMLAVVGENKPRRAATPFGGGGVDGGAITIGGSC